MYAIRSYYDAQPPMLSPLSWCLMAGHAAPQLIEPPVTSAGGTVEFVADRVLLVIVLVVFLGREELGGLHDLGYDWLFEGLGFFQLCL